MLSRNAFTFFAVMAFSVGLGALSLMAGVPGLINYQGRITDPLGTPRDTVVDISFTIFEDEGGTSDLWSETHSAVPVVDGLFHLYLGDVDSIPSAIFSGETRFLGMAVGTDPIGTPLIPIVSVPYALLAQTVPEGTINSLHLEDGGVGLEDIGQNGAAQGFVMKWIDDHWIAAEDANDGGFELPYGGSVTSTGDAFSIGNDGTGPGVRGAAQANDGVIGYTGAVDKSGVYGYSPLGTGVSGRSEGESHGVYGESNASTLEHAGVYGMNLGSGPGVSAHGNDLGLRVTTGASGTAALLEGDVLVSGGLSAVTSSTAAGQFATDDFTVGSDSAVLRAEYFGPNSAFKTLSAIEGICVTEDSAGIGACFQGGYTGLWSEAVQSTRDGAYYGVMGSVSGDFTGSLSTQFTGAYFQAVGSDISETIGCQTYVKGGAYNAGFTTSILVPHGQNPLISQGLSAYIADSKQAYGVNLEVYAYHGPDSVHAGLKARTSGAVTDYGSYLIAEGDSTNYGIYAEAKNGANANYGIWAEAPNGMADWAGYFVGDVMVTGTMYATSKSFRIDHPLDPENKYLVHSCVESPDQKTVYDGTIVLDSDGAAVVELPDYFEALNQEFRYQLTCIGGYAPVYVSDEVDGNRFGIAGGSAGLKVCWQVTGVRNDPAALAQPMEVEMEKPFDKRGTYLNPAAYGLGEESDEMHRERAKRDNGEHEFGKHIPKPPEMQGRSQR